MNRATKRCALWLSALLLAASLMVGCDGGEPDMPRVTPAGDESAIRNFTAEEIDSLQALKRRKPGFSENHYGFRSFGKLLEEAQARKLLVLGKDERSGTHIAKTLA